MNSIENDDVEVSKDGKSPEESFSSSPSFLSKKLRFMVPIALAAMTALAPACKTSESKDETDISLPRSTRNDFWDGHDEYFKEIPNGKFNKEEYESRLKKLSNGETIFEDIGALVFYRVEEGDTTSKIREKLSKYKRFKYLKTSSREKIKSFNIPRRSLEAGMLIPIPLAEKDRLVTDGQFVNYCNEAIDEMVVDATYGKMVKRIIEKTSKQEILKVMLAVVKQESGGKPIGQFELHRWEPGQKAFSFSLFHVLMTGPGMKARQKLNMTEGQVYHPKNGAKLFLAFLCEKSKKGNSSNPERFFPLIDHLESFARFYNGANWKRVNPNYIHNIKRFYGDAGRLLSGKHKVARRRSSTTRPEVRSGLRPVCKKILGRRCVLEPKRFSTNKRLLEMADVSRALGAETLKRHYCKRIKYLLEGQRTGRFSRPRRHWKRTYSSRKRYIRKKCGG